MKVNIKGVGLIPRVGLLAPVFGKDLSKDTVSVILKYSSFKVYVAATGIRITRKNIDQIFGESVQQSVARPTAVNIIPSAPVVEKVAAPTPVEIEKVSEPVVLDTVVEAPAIEEPVEPVEEPVEEVPADEGFPVDDIVDEDTPAEEETEKPVYTSKKKKRR